MYIPDRPPLDSDLMTVWQTPEAVETTKHIHTPERLVDDISPVPIVGLAPASG